MPKERPSARFRPRTAGATGAVRTLAPVWSVAKREPSAFLFAGQIIGVLLYPLMTGSVGRAAFSLFGIAILGLVVLAVNDSPGLTWVAIGLALPATVLPVSYTHLTLPTNREV